ncbi:hypothetical protein [Microbacterium sp.]|uniref:hypothetical protein n=1 Tax=Microbacterium sp. TaxID=51671 RepID=UPI0033406B11
MTDYTRRIEMLERHAREIRAFADEREATAIARMSPRSRPFWDTMHDVEQMRRKASGLAREAIQLRIKSKRAA